MKHKIHTLKQKIESLEDLWHYLNVAMEVELATIPAYLCALYSIKPGTNQAAADVIHSIVIEEMLHMILVGNVLNATGGTAKLNVECFVPKYPTALPDSNIKNHRKTFKVPLQKFTPDAIKTFLKIEHPTRPHAIPKVEGWHSSGQFYDGLRKGLNDLCKDGPEKVFTGDPSFQIRREDYYGGAGKVIVVADKSAKRMQELANDAFEEIVDQGEGLHNKIFDGDTIPGKGDESYPVPAHYFRFMEIKKGKYYGPKAKPKDKPSGDCLKVDYDEVYPMRKNPSMSQYDEGSEIWEKMLDFNRTYMELLNLLQDAFSGKRERLMEAVTVMYDLKYKAVALMKIPTGDGETTVGPSFEYLPSEKR